MKLRENLKEHDIFPTSLHIYQKSRPTWTVENTDNKEFKKTVKMITYEDFKEDPNSFTVHIVKVFKASFDEGALPFPAMMLGATV